jgi:hypothetical protein
VSVFGVGVDEALALAETDPAVEAGRFAAIALPWNVPAGVIAFPGDVKLPRSVADVLGD